MGLTISYRLAAPKVKTFQEALALLTQLRNFAATLGVHECSKILTWEEGKDDPTFARLFHYYKPIGASKSKLLNIPPQRFAVFALNQQGSEPAWFGLALFHKKAFATHDASHLRPTGLAGFHWNAFCKTQYAAMTQHGGFPNFFKIHDAICRTLDQARKLGLKIHVHDDGHYFKKRDPASLAKEIGKYNALVAAFTGQMKDALPDTPIVAPITSDPTFEHLEAKGQKLIKGKTAVRAVLRAIKKRKKKK